MGNSGSPEKRPSSELDGADPLKQNLSPRKSKEIDRNIAVVTPINIKDTTLAEEKKIVKISIIGSVSVGKKTLFCQYLFGRLPSSADKKLDNEKKTIDIDSNSVILNILEMGSMCVTEDLLDPLIYFADAVILMYSVADKKSFNIIPLFIAKILNQKKSNRFPIAIVANKVDATEREISLKQGCGLAERFGASYFETSAKNGLNIETPFITLATSVLNARRNSSDQDKVGIIKKNTSSLLA